MQKSFTISREDAEALLDKSYDESLKVITTDGRTLSLVHFEISGEPDMHSWCYYQDFIIKDATCEEYYICGQPPAFTFPTESSYCEAFDTEYIEFLPVKKVEKLVPTKVWEIIE